MSKKKAIIIGAIGAALIVLTVVFFAPHFGIFSFSPPKDQVAIRVEEFQKRIDELTQRNKAMEAEMADAKRESAMAYERAQANAKTARDWMIKYQQADEERRNLKRATSGTEAVNELRKMGWIK